MRLPLSIIESLARLLKISTFVCVYGIFVILCTFLTRGNVKEALEWGALKLKILFKGALTEKKVEKHSSISKKKNVIFLIVHQETREQ